MLGDLPDGAPGPEDSFAGAAAGPQPPVAEVGRVRFSLSNYDGRLPFHPIPEESGFLIVTNEKTCELRFAGKAQVWQCPLGRYPLSFTRTGPKSCRILIRDHQDPGVASAFDLPDTSYEELTLALDTLGVPIRGISAVAEYSPWVASHGPAASRSQLDDDVDSDVYDETSTSPGEVTVDTHLETPSS